jgi:hypothetical protein
MAIILGEKLQKLVTIISTKISGSEANTTIQGHSEK